MAFQAGAIVSKLTLDRSKFSASIKAVKKQSKNLGSWVKKNSGQFKAMGLAATAAGVAVLMVFKKMVKQYVETGDMIHKMALRTGFAAETLSELAFAAEISGADITMLEKGTKKMAKTISDASDGLETYLRVFRKLGLEVDDLLKMKPEEQFFTIGAAIAEMENVTLKTAAAIDVFGKSGTMLLPFFKEGAEGIAKLRKEAHLVGEIFDKEMAAKAAKLNDAQRALTGSVRGLSFAILTDLIPVLTTVTKSFTDWFVGTRENAATWAMAIISFFEVIAKGAMTLMAGLQLLQSATFEMASLVTQNIRGYIEQLIIGFGALAKVGVPVKGILKDLMQAWVDLRAVEEGYSEQQEKHINQAAVIIAGFSEFFKILESVEKKLKDVKKAGKDVITPLEKALIPLTRPLKMGPLLFNIPKMTAEDFAIWYKKWLADLKAKWASAWQAALSGSRNVVGALESLFNQFAKNQSVRLENEEKEQTDHIEAWYERNRARIEATIMSETAKVAALEALDEEKARKENKLQVQMDKERRKLERKRAKAQKASALVSAGINVAEAITKALTAGPLIGQIFAGIVAALGAVQMAAIAAAPLPALAKGGRIGAAGIVGEEGPELFFPGTPGTIVPLRSEATPLGSQPNISIRIMGSLISTTGVARADLERAGNTFFDIIEMQARRRGYTLNGA